MPNLYVKCPQQALRCPGSELAERSFCGLQPRLPKRKCPIRADSCVFLKDTLTSFISPITSTVLPDIPFHNSLNSSGIVHYNSSPTISSSPKGHSASQSHHITSRATHLRVKERWLVLLEMQDLPFVTLGECLPISEPSFLHCEMVTVLYLSYRVVEGFDVSVFAKYFAHCHRKGKLLG